MVKPPHYNGTGSSIIFDQAGGLSCREGLKAPLSLELLGKYMDELGQIAAANHHGMSYVLHRCVKRSFRHFRAKAAYCEFSCWRAEDLAISSFKFVSTNASSKNSDSETSLPVG